MVQCVRSAAVLTAVAGLAAASVSADVLTFNNACGNGLWGSTCSSGPGSFQSNWGRSGPSPAGLLPGPIDTAVISGTVTMDVSPTVAEAVVPGGTSLLWTNASFTGVLNNNGTVTVSSGFNKFLTGSASNNAGGQWSIADGSFYLSMGSLTNYPGATLTLGQNGSIRRNAGGVEQNWIDQRGVFRVTGPNTTISGVRLTGDASSQWQTLPGSSLTLDAVQFAGRFHALHMGGATLTGQCTLAGNATFSTDSTGQPWGWRDATLDTGAATLTNSGRLLLSTGFNKFLSGTIFNDPNGTLTVAEGNLYMTPSIGPTLVHNAGTLIVGGGIRRNAGGIDDSRLNNSGFIESAAGASTISGITVTSSNGQWSRFSPALTLDACKLSGTFDGAAYMTGDSTLGGDTTLNSSFGGMPWTWTTMALNTGAFRLFNNGSVETTGGFNKFLSGQAVNAPSGSWKFQAGTFYLYPAEGGFASFTNYGTTTFAANTSLSRNGGIQSVTRFINSGQVVSAGPGAAVRSVSVEGTGVWRTNAGASLSLDGVALSGTFTGDHAGWGELNGDITLNGDVNLTTTPASQPWQWTSAAVDTGNWTLTNSGKLQCTGGFNKFISGRMVNAPGAELICGEGTFYLYPSGISSIGSLTNNGTITLANGRPIARNGGLPQMTVLTNNALVRVTGPGSSVASITFNNGAAGVVKVDAGASLQFADNWTLTDGRVQGFGTFGSSGTPGLTNSGTVAPGEGSTTGELSCSGRFVQAADGTLEIAVVNNGSQQNVSRLLLTQPGFFGQAVLGGTLRVTLPTGAAPLGGNDYVIVNAPGGLSGTFASVVPANPLADYRYMVVYTPTQALLRVIRRCGDADLGSAGADTNFDGLLDNNDFIVFINLFFAQDPQADVGIAGGLFGGDGLFDNNDFIAFIDLFFDGCS